MADELTEDLRSKVRPNTKARLEAAADDRMIGVHRLVDLAINDFLDRLVPVEELELVRPRDPQVGTNVPGDTDA